MTGFKPSDRRQFGRRQTTIHGWICIEGRPRVPCVLANLSLGGALLQLERPTWLPYTFRLVCETVGIDIMCEVRHHVDRSVGVRFMEQQAAAPSKGEASAGDRESWSGSTTVGRPR